MSSSKTNMQEMTFEALHTKQGSQGWFAYLGISSVRTNQRTFLCEAFNFLSWFVIPRPEM